MLKILHVIKKFSQGEIQSVICSWYDNIDREKSGFDFVLHWHDGKGVHEDEVTQKGKKLYIFKTLAEPQSIRRYKKQGFY